MTERENEAAMLRRAPRPRHSLQHESGYTTTTTSCDTNTQSSRIGARSISLRVPDIGNPRARIDPTKLHYVPHALCEIEVRIGRTGPLFSIHVPNIPVDELPDDFIPLQPGVAQNRTIWLLPRAYDTHQGWPISGRDWSVGQIVEREGGVPLAFYDS